ncbi:hypothetical protein [Streptomyces naphthomycinicus]|uniref:hypothetical protein n=1 Tax=Streptomyces naphthomycinicus TaxID=2872625 RepID=UPI001CECBCB3|nr:hypothetical protein [Streptomyces sp. TML10]
MTDNPLADAARSLTQSIHDAGAAFRTLATEIEAGEQRAAAEIAEHPDIANLGHA